MWEETPYHFFGKCCASMMFGAYLIFGAYLMELKELHKVKPATLLWFENLREVFIIFGYIGDAHWAALDWPQRWVA